MTATRILIPPPTGMSKPLTVATVKTTPPLVAPTPPLMAANARMVVAKSRRGSGKLTGSPPAEIESRR